MMIRLTLKVPNCGKNANFFLYDSNYLFEIIPHLAFSSVLLPPKIIILIPRPEYCYFSTSNMNVLQLKHMSTTSVLSYEICINKYFNSKYSFLVSTLWNLA